jgi:hypothetical protein
VIVERIDTEKLNPFGATGEELLAYALDDAGLLTPATVIDGRPAREYLEAFFRKRDFYRETTKLGEVLVRGRAITSEQLTAALRLQAEHHDLKLGEALLEIGACSFEEIHRALEDQASIRGDLRDIDDHRAYIAAIRDRLRQYF